MNAIDFLIKEHERVRKLLAEISEASQEKKRDELFSTLCSELIRHEEMEHTVWYPFFKNHPKLTDEVKHLIKEENHAEKVIASFKDIKTEAGWQEKFKKFKKDVEHHATEEEEKLFPHVKKIFDDSELEEIGKQMRQFKADYKE